MLDEVIAKQYVTKLASLVATELTETFGDDYDSAMKHGIIVESKEDESKVLAIVVEKNNDDIIYVKHATSGKLSPKAIFDVFSNKGIVDEAVLENCNINLVFDLEETEPASSEAIVIEK